MRRFSIIAYFAPMSLVLAQPAQTPMKLAAEVLGADKIRALQFSASGDSFTVGQNYSPNDPWPRVPVKSFAALINYETGSMRLDMLRESGPTMPRGGGVPFSGELHQFKRSVENTLGTSRLSPVHRRAAQKTWRPAARMRRAALA